MRVVESDGVGVQQRLLTTSPALLASPSPRELHEREHHQAYGDAVAELDNRIARA